MMKVEKKRKKKKKYKMPKHAPDHGYLLWLLCACSLGYDDMMTNENMIRSPPITIMMINLVRGGHSITIIIVSGAAQDEGVDI